MISEGSVVVGGRCWWQLPKPLIQVISGTTRPERFGDRVKEGVLGYLSANAPDLAVESLDLRDHPLPFFAGPASPARSPREYLTPEVERFGQTVDRADGYLMLTGE